MKSSSALSASELTRRAFLKTSATTAVALGTLDLSPRVHAAGRGIIHVGMIGCGGRNRGAAVQALRPIRGRASSPWVTSSWTAFMQNGN